MPALGLGKGDLVPALGLGKGDLVPAVGLGKGDLAPALGRNFNCCTVPDKNVWSGSCHLT